MMRLLELRRRPPHPRRGWLQEKRMYVESLRVVRAVAGMPSVLVTRAAAHGAVTHPAARVLSDLSKPLKISWLAPTDASTVSGTLSGSGCQVVTHDRVAIAKVVFSLDGTTVNTDTRPPYSCQIDTTPLAGGTHILKAKAYDLTGFALSGYLFVTVPWTGSPPITVTLQGDSLTD